MIKIFIGTEPAQWVPTMVLKHSIITRTKEDVTFVELQGLNLDLRISMYTGFSFYRFAIPEYCKFAGKAVYMDADEICLCDIAELLNLDMLTKGVLARKRDSISRYTSVMLMDCPKLTHWKMATWIPQINAKKHLYRATMWAMPDGLNHSDFTNLPEWWNHMDTADAMTKILHYTNVPTQPWKKSGHPFANLFLKEMRSALRSGFISTEDIKREILAGHVHNGLLTEVEHAH